MTFINKIKNQLNLKNIILLSFSFTFLLISSLLILSLSSSMKYFYVMLIGVLPIILYTMFDFGRKENLIILIVSLIVSLVIYFFMFEDVNIGLKIFTNQVMEKSQELTKYRYEYININVTKASYGYYLKKSLFIFALVFGNVIYLSSKYLKGLLMGILIVLNMFVRIYFGIYEQNYLMLLLIIIYVLYLIINSSINNKNKQITDISKLRTGAVISIVIIFSSIVIIGCEKTYHPIQNLTVFTETIRDNLTPNIIQDDNNGDNSNQSPIENDNQDNTNPNDGESSTATSNKANIPYIFIILIVIFSCILVFPIVIFIIKRIKAKILQKELKENKSCNITKLFNLSFEWLKIGGLIPSNIGYLNYMNQLEKYNIEYQNNYKEACEIYLRVTYSNYELDMNDLEFMRKFYLDTKEIVLNNLSKTKRIMMKVGRSI